MTGGTASWLPGPDRTEINFWRPGGRRAFRVLQPGEPFFRIEGVRGSCKGLRRLISAGFQGCMSIPGWSGGGDNEGSVAGDPGLVDLIATAGLATDDPHEGSGLARTGLGRLQNMSGSRCRARCSGTVADGLLPAVPPNVGTRRPGSASWMPSSRQPGSACSPVRNVSASSSSCAAIAW
jgi:hypothetical protein